MKELVGRYRDKIFQIQNIPTLRDLNKSLRHKKSISLDNHLPQELKKQYCVKLIVKRNMTIDSTSEKKNIEELRKATRTIFFELRNIKRTLIRSSKDIEDIFISPKKTFNRFSIEQCQREEFVNTLVNDHFVQYLIRSTKDAEFTAAINEIEEDKDNNLSQMSDFLYFLNQGNYWDIIWILEDKIYLDPLNLDYISANSSTKVKNKIKNKGELDLDIDELVKFIYKNEEEKKKPKKKKKRNTKKGAENKINTSININDSNNGKNTENNIIKDDGIETFKISLKKISRYSFEVQKIKTRFSKEWLDNITTYYINI